MCPSDMGLAASCVSMTFSSPALFFTSHAQPRRLTVTFVTVTACPQGRYHIFYDHLIHICVVCVSLVCDSGCWAGFTLSFGTNQIKCSPSFSLWGGKRVPDTRRGAFTAAAWQKGFFCLLNQRNQACAYREGVSKKGIHPDPLC